MLFWTIQNLIIGQNFQNTSSCHISNSTVYNTCSMTEFFYRQWLLISSSYQRSDLIFRIVLLKTYHNDSEIVHQLRLHGRVVEPLEDFHKDEVRALCRELDPPAELQERHPFPGPGLSIRIIYAEGPVLIRLMVHYANIAAKEHVLPNRIEIVTSEEERLIWKNCPVTTSMLPRYCLFALSVFRYRRLQKNVSGMENKA
ncbi:putative GMP synthase [Daphnia magna]|uniref:Putative GMP synthase n=1 Tax=Daphnia magna TaxID=35525 RepID=A0A164V2E8_9CRUS|nr:putative GMP synthase [Daphnia magna]